MAGPTEVFTDPEPDVIPERGPAVGSEPQEGKGSLAAMTQAFKKNMAPLYDESGQKRDKPAEPPAEPAKQADGKPQAEQQKPADAKPEPAKTDPKPDDIPEIIKSPKAADEFRKLKALKEAAAQEAEKTKAELAQAKAELEAAIKRPAVKPEEVEALKKERDEILSQFERVSLEHSPAFQAKFQPVVDAIRQNAIAAAGDKNKDAVSHILELGPSDTRKKALAAITEGMDQLDAIQLTMAVTQMDGVRNERARMLANHRETLKAQEEQAAAIAQYEEQQRKAKAEALKARVVEIAREKYDAFKDDGTPEAKTRVMDYLADVEKTLTGKLTDSEMAMLPVLAAEGDYIKQHELPKLKARVAELEEQLAKVGSSLPTLEGSADKGGGGRAPGSSFIAKYNELQGRS